MSNKRLIQVYMYGWDNCGDGKDCSSLYKGLELKAYNLGWSDYIVGDDVTSNDEKTEDEILREIKGFWKYNLNL